MTIVRRFIKSRRQTLGRSSQDSGIGHDRATEREIGGRPQKVPTAALPMILRHNPPHRLSLVKAVEPSHDSILYRQVRAVRDEFMPWKMGFTPLGKGTESPGTRSGDHP